MMETKQQTDLQDALTRAVIESAVSTEDSYSSPPKLGAAKEKMVVSPLTGAEMRAGRQKGSVNRVTRTIREAVEKAAQDCHAEGLAGWLIERAQGGIQDRQIFAQMVNKAMPLQVQANVGGGVKLELSWLSSRSIGTSAAQSIEHKTQVIDLQQDSAGEYRIIDQDSTPTGGADADGGDGGQGGQAGSEGAGAAQDA